MTSKFDRKNREKIPVIPVDDQLRGLPGMLNLDNIKEKISSYLQKEMAEIKSCKISYIRYKPGTSCIIAYRIELSKDVFSGSSDLRLYAKVFTAENFPNGAGKARSHRWVSLKNIDPVIICPEYDSILYLFPNDAAIDGLRILSDSKKIQRILYQHYHRYPEKEWRISDRKLKITVARYKPERRAVLECVTRARNRETDKKEPLDLFIRIYPNNLGENVYGIQQSLYRLSLSQKGLIIPMPVCYMQERKLLIMESIGGNTLADEIAKGNSEAFQSTAMALSLLHLKGPQDLPERNIDSFMKEANATVETLNKIAPDTRDLVESIYSGLVGYSPKSSSSDPGFVHGDFHPGQVVIQSDAAGIIDFDRSHCGDVMADIGNFLAHLRLLRLSGESSGGAGLEEDFIRAYQERAETVIETDLLKFWTAFGLFQLAVGPFRRLEDCWREKIKAILLECQSILS